MRGKGEVGGLSLWPTRFTATIVAQASGAVNQMATQHDLEALEIYQSLMVEAKARALSINTLANNQRGIPSPLVREYGFLQVRMLCEIIALGCLVAHGNLVKIAPKKLAKAYAPGEIISALESLHDDFFPVPIDPEKTLTGWHMAEHTGGPHLKKGDVSKLWARCGGILHRGDLKTILRRQNPVQNNFADLSDAAQKILNLLSRHRIVRSDGQLVFIAFLQDDLAGGDVRVVLGKAERPSSER